MFHTSTTASGTRDSPLVMYTVLQKKQEETALSVSGSHISGSLSSHALTQHPMWALWGGCHMAMLPSVGAPSLFLSGPPPNTHTHTHTHTQTHNCPSNCCRRQGGRHHLSIKGKQTVFRGEVAFFRTHRTQRGWMRLGPPGGASVGCSAVPICSQASRSSGLRLAGVL